MSAPSPGGRASELAYAAPIDLQRLDLDAFRGRPVAVLGLARSGLAATRFLVDRGAQVTVYDGRPAEQLGEALAALEERPVRTLLGPDADPTEALAGQSLVCTSPSISSRYPTTEPRLRAALASVEADGRVPVVSEVDLFLRLCPATTIGVTGTKGKTTTSSLIAAVLGAAGAPVLLGGNIGTPLVERLPELTPRHRVVIELSELQLPTLSRGTDVVVYTHVTQDHLDRHGSVEAYRAVKRRLAELARRDGRLVLNAEDPVTSAYAAMGTAPSLLYRRSRPMPGGVGIVDGWVVAEDLYTLPAVGGLPVTTGPGGRVLPVAEVRLPGPHNLSNVLAGVGVALIFGVAPDGIRRAVAAFEGVEHRLETVAVIDGVRYVNDSQGTQPDAVVAALRSFPSGGPLVLIAGGRDKGSPLDDLARVAVERAGSVILIGENAPVLELALRTAGHADVRRAATLEAAVADAAAIAQAAMIAGGALRTGGARRGVVLLSPAAASFDMFPDYAARGRAFKEAVASVAGAAALTDHRSIT
ncbi:UDP-N-acetylmuramoyl-L-alanine--D-glutamate ligase [soil metagenome]